MVIKNTGETILKQKNYSVSVIVPVLNTKEYICECLSSLSKQTMKNIEVICVDGGSSDGTLEIIKDYVKRDNRFRLITDTKGSYGAQVNRGVELAKGKYVAIAEPDDYVSEGMYEALYEEAIETDADIVKADYCRFIGEGEERFYFPKSACKDNWYGKNLRGKDEKELLENTPANWSGIYKKSFLIKENIYHNTTKGAAYQDVGFWFLTTVLASKIRFIPVTGYYYRIDNPNSSINATNKENCLRDELNWLENQLESRGIFEEFQDKYQRVKFIHTDWMRRKVEDLTLTKCFNAVKKSDKKSCVLFGCGADGVEYLVMLKHKGLIDRVKFLTDNDSTLWGKKLLGIPVVNPNEAVKLYRDVLNGKGIYIISSTRYKEQIKEQLRLCDIEEERIFQIGE